MRDPLRTKFHRWLGGMTLIPPLVLMLFCLFLLWRAMQERQTQAFDRVSEVALAHIDQVVQSEVIRLRNLANSPTAVGLIQVSQRRDTADDRPEELELQWAKAGRDDLLVRGVLDNDLATVFKRVMDQEPQIRLLAMTDARGNLIASTEKTPRYSQAEQSWWKNARMSPAGQACAETLTTNGRINIVSPVLRPGFTNMSDGHMRMEVDVGGLMQRLPMPELPPNAIVYLVGQNVFPLVGKSNEALRAQGEIKNFITAGLRDNWAGGYRFRASNLDGGLNWRDPVLLVGALKQPRIPMSLLLGVVAILLGGGLLMGGLFALVRHLVDRIFLEQTRVLSEAGIWILRTAYGEEAKKHPALQQPWTETITERTSQIQRDLARWINKWRQSLQAQDVSLTQEMKRDLEMATEFQQAFLSRPYPVIPEVHLEGRLRLEFHHRYQPALAMGGDFFDITALANDCAGILVADVMGHGMRSALIVSMLRTLIAELSRRGRNAPHFLRELNNQFCVLLKSLPSPFFASASYFVADTTGRIATYSFAGHPPPFHLHRSMGRVARLESPKPQGAALGLVPDEDYGGASIRLEAGDAFFFFTDGVYEAANRHGEEFGPARLEKLLRTLVYRNSPEILDGVIHALREFTGEEAIADDICMVMVDVTDTLRR